MTEILGYIMLYLLVGALLLPLGRTVKRIVPKGKYYGNAFEVVLWPLTTVANVVIIWLYLYGYRNE